MIKQLLIYKDLRMKNDLLQQLKRLKQLKISKVNQDKNEAVVKDIKVKSNKKFQKSMVIIDQANEVNKCFEGISFCFPIKDVELSPAVIKNLTNLIINRSGTVVPFLDDIKQAKVNFLICSKLINIQNVEKKLKGKLIYQQILDYLFIKQCVTRNMLLNIDTYILFHPPKKQHFYRDLEQQKQEKTIFMSDLVKKKVKTSTNITFNQFDLTTKNNLEWQCQDYSAETQPPIVNYQTKQMFACDFPAKDGISFSFNNFICEQLGKLLKIYEDDQDLGRKIAYMKAISIVRNLNYEINHESLESIKNIGKKIKKKIKELLQTGTLKKLQFLQMNETLKIKSQLTKVWGIGPNKAIQLLNKGIKSIQDLRNKQQLLNKNQKIGLRHFEDFQKRIPRQKVGRIFTYLKQKFQKLNGNDKHQLLVCGSYRRNKPDCGDIDLLISRKDGFFQKHLLTNYIKELEKDGFITDTLSLVKANNEHASISFMGVCRFEDQIFHRIDIKYYPVDEWAFAVLYFTGSDYFNRSMRLLARKKGYSLSDHGIKNNKTGLTQEQYSKQKHLVFQNQEDIFAFFGLDYKTPQQRNL